MKELVHHIASFQRHVRVLAKPGKQNALAQGRKPDAYFLEVAHSFTSPHISMSSTAIFHVMNGASQRMDKRKIGMSKPPQKENDRSIGDCVGKDEGEDVILPPPSR
jgi:hypothetical protein